MSSVRLLRNSTAHIQAVARIDVTYAPQINALREFFIDKNPGINQEEMESDPAWISLSATIRQEWDEELAVLRSVLVDSPDKL